jgi:hypothetical protein
VIYPLPTAFCFSSPYAPAFILTVSNIDRLPKLSRQLNPIRGARGIVDKARTEIDVQDLDPF